MPCHADHRFWFMAHCRGNPVPSTRRI